MAADYFLIYGAEYAPKEFKAWEVAKLAHYDYFLALDLSKLTAEQDAEGLRLKAIADRAEAKARRAFSLSKMPVV